MNDQNFVQSLEPRRLLAASFASLSSHGTLSVIGTAKNDTITISLTNNMIVAKLNASSMSFAKSSVKRIWADGVHGNDHIENDTALPSTLLGSSGDDTLRGGSGDDSLDGGEGVDLIQPRDGNNAGNFELSRDVLDYDGARPGNFGLTFDGDSHQNLDVTHGASSNDRFACAIGARPVLRFFGTSGDDHIGGSLFFDAVVHGGKGNDVLGVTSSIDNDQPSNITVLGEEGNDSLSASGEDIFIALADGGPGDDSYDYFNSHGGAGPFIDTGGGNDSLSVELIPDNSLTVQVPEGIENCSVGAQTQGTVKLTGNSLSNELSVGGDAAIIRGGGGNDTIRGTDGNDSLFGDDGNDVLYGGDGKDTLDGGPGRDKLLGQDGNDTIYAKDGRTDTLDGGAGFDSAQRDSSATIKDQVLNIEKFT